MSSPATSLARRSPPPAAAPTSASPNATATTPNTALPREVLTWLQSLGLGNAVKNPKRDLANGAVLAQICAHYWSGVPLHSFANGVGTRSKEGNWYVLQKVLRKHEIAVSPAMVSGMVGGTEGCAEAFLKQLYTVFTGKTLEEAAVPLPEPLVEVASRDVPVLTPSTANNAAARARQAAEGAAMGGLGGGGGAATPHSAAASGAPGTSPASRYPAMPTTAKRALTFAASTASGEAYFNSSTHGSTVKGAAGSAAPAKSATMLLPIAPPPPGEATFSAAALASGKPALNISVRPAGQVSTVVPVQPAGAALSSATNSGGGGGDAVDPGNGKTVGGGVEGDDEGKYPPGTSIAAAWFCAKVRDALPAEALEAFANSSSQAISPLTPLTSTLFWLAAPEGVFDADFVYSSESDEQPVRVSQAELRDRVWRSLRSHVHELADVVLQCAVHGLDVLVDALFDAVGNTVVCEGARPEDEDRDPQYHNGNHEESAQQQLHRRGRAEGQWGREVATGVVFVRHTLQLCTSLLAHLSDADAHAAVRCFQLYFLGSENFARAVYEVRWCVAHDYARLLVTTLPPSRGAATTVLETQWASLETIVRNAATTAAAAEAAMTVDVDTEAEEDEEPEDADGDRDSEEDRTGAPALNEEEEGSEDICSEAWMAALLASSHSAAATAAVQAEVSLLTLLRALVETLLPYHGGTAATLLPTSAPASAGGVVSDGTRTPSARVRGARAAAVSASSEETGFNAFVARLAHRRCARVLRALHRERNTRHPPQSDPAAQTHGTRTLLAAKAVLAEVAVALAVDLLRVELTAPLITSFVRGDAFFDVYNFLFAPSPAASAAALAESHDDVDAGTAAHEKANKLLWLALHPHLAVLRARWLRWCVQRQWQCGMLRSGRPADAASGLAGGLPPPSSESFAGSVAGLSDGGHGTAQGKDTTWAAREEVRAVFEGCQAVCAELFAPPAELGANQSKHVATSAQEEAEAKACQVAKVLIASTVAEALPFLPPQYKTETLAISSQPFLEAGEADSRGAVSRRTTQLLSMHSVHPASTTAAPAAVHNGENGLGMDFVCAEAVAEACLHVFMRETAPSQMHALLCGAASPGETANALRDQRLSSQRRSVGDRRRNTAGEDAGRDAIAGARVEKKETDSNIRGEDGGEEVEDAGVSLLHPFVGPLTPYGPLVWRSDALLLVKAMLCVLETTQDGAPVHPTASATAARASTEKEVAVVARRLGARAAIVAREGQLEDALATRIAWMHALLVEGRGQSVISPLSINTNPRGAASAVPTTTTARTGAVLNASFTPASLQARSGEASTSPSPPPPLLLPNSTTPPDNATRRSHGVTAGMSFDDDVVAQWHGVILECWDTFMLVLQAATLRLKQRGTGAAASVAAATSGVYTNNNNNNNSSTSGSGAATVDAAVLREALGAKLLLCAQQAQEVVCCLEHELSMALPEHGALSTTAGGYNNSTATMAAAEMSSSMPGRSEGVTLNSALLSGPLATFVNGTAAEAVQAAVSWMWGVVGGA